MNGKLKCDNGNCNLFFLINYFQDTFFYCLVFDPAQKTLLADKGEIRVGSRYQAEPIPLLRDGSKLFEADGNPVFIRANCLTDRFR